MTAYNVISPLLMQNGQPEDISIPKANFDAIAAVVNGGLDDSNIAANANIQMSKIAPGGTWGGVTFNQGNMTLPGYIHGVGDIYAQYGNAPVVGIGALGVASQAAIKFGGDTTLFRNTANELTTNILHATNLQDRSEKAVAGGYASLDGQAHVPVAQLPDVSATYQLVSQKGQPNGYASLGANGLVPGSQLPPGLDPAQVQTRSEKGQPNGYASLDASAKVPIAQLPDISTTYQVTSQKGQANGYAGLNASGVVPLTQLDLSTMQARSEKAIANGYASLDGTGKVPSAQLPPIGADLVYDGDFTGASYKDGDIVVYNNVAYLCTAPTSAAPTAWPGGPPGAAPNYVVAYGTSLPASPTDGMEAVLVDSVTNPTYQWRFRYNGQSTATYKWEFVGGSDGISIITTDETNAVADSQYKDLTTPGPDFIVPRAGDYFAAAQADNYHTATPWSVSVAPALPGGSPPVTTGNIAGPTGNAIDGFCRVRFNALTAGQTIRVRYANGTTGTAHHRSRHLWVTPIRVS